MRLALFTVLALCLLATALANPSKHSWINKFNCSTDCGDVHEPVCAESINRIKTRLQTFDSHCILHKYNCQHIDDPFQFLFVGECSNLFIRV